MTLKDLTAVSLCPVSVCSFYGEPYNNVSINYIFKSYSGLLAFDVVKLGIFQDGTLCAYIDAPPETIEHLRKLTADPTKNSEV